MPVPRSTPVVFGQRREQKGKHEKNVNTKKTDNKLQQYQIDLTLPNLSLLALDSPTGDVFVHPVKKSYIELFTRGDK